MYIMGVLVFIYSCIDVYTNLLSLCTPQALGCVLYKLCYYRTPYDDGSKMAICNAELKLPAARGPNVVFHDMISMCLLSCGAFELTQAHLLHLEMITFTDSL